MIFLHYIILISVCVISLFLAIIYFVFVYSPAQIQLKLRNEAKNRALEVSKIFPELKNEFRSIEVQRVIFAKTFDRERLEEIPGSSKKRMEICCKTVNGFCYMMALDVGLLKGLINIRSIQFTEYMDKELELAGFPSQSLDQKKEILKIMQLDEAFEGVLKAREQNKK